MDNALLGLVAGFVLGVVATLTLAARARDAEIREHRRSAIEVEER